MTNTVYLITGLEPDTKYEVKARMYSNAGIGPFSELQLVTTSVGEKSFFVFFSRGKFAPHGHFMNSERWKPVLHLPLFMHAKAIHYAFYNLSLGYN